jgi:hypothetical protein
VTAASRRSVRLRLQLAGISSVSAEGTPVCQIQLRSCQPAAAAASAAGAAAAKTEVNCRLCCVPHSLAHLHQL